MSLYNTTNSSFNNLYELFIEVNVLEPAFFITIYFTLWVIMFIIQLKAANMMPMEAFLNSTMMALVPALLFMFSGLLPVRFFFITLVMFGLASIADMIINRR